MSPRARRLARGWSAALLGTTLAAGSHAALDGTWPPPLVIALSTCLAAPVCMLLSGRALSRAGVAASVAVSQLLLHLLFAQSGAMVHAATRTHHHGTAALEEPQQLLTSVPPVTHHSGAMLAAHVLAALATYALLRHGEVAVVRLLAACSLRVLRLLNLLPRPVLPPVPRRTSWSSPRALSDQLLLSSLCGYRGPPAAT